METVHNDREACWNEMLERWNELSWCAHAFHETDMVSAKILLWRDITCEQPRTEAPASGGGHDTPRRSSILPEGLRVVRRLADVRCGGCCSAPLQPWGEPSGSTLPLSDTAPAADPPRRAGALLPVCRCAPLKWHVLSPSLQAFPIAPAAASVKDSPSAARNEHFRMSSTGVRAVRMPPVFIWLPAMPPSGSSCSSLPFYLLVRTLDSGTAGLERTLQHAHARHPAPNGASSSVSLPPPAPPSAFRSHGSRSAPTCPSGVCSGCSPRSRLPSPATSSHCSSSRH